MKRKIIYCALLLFGCTYGERAEWDSGAEAQNVYQEQRQEEVTEGAEDRIPPITKPKTEAPQPF